MTTTRNDHTAVRRPPSAPSTLAREYAVPMTDGTLLATDIYLPAAGQGPVLLSRLPYDKTGSECFLPEVATWFTRHGYVVAVQDVRGKLRSGGEVEPFTHEVSDGYGTIEWLTQQSFCTGPIGMLGDSYYGFTQWAAAASGHPALAAIAPRVTSADLGIWLADGTFPLEVAASWSLETWVDEALYEYEGALDWSVRPQSEIVPGHLGGARTVGLDDWARGLVSDQARLPVPGRVPALHLGGFNDFLLPGQLATWERSRKGPGADWLVLDARDHGWTRRRRPDEPYQDPQLSRTRMRAFLDDYLGPLLPFFDHHLRGAGAFEVAPVRWRVADEWHEATTWPPPGLTRQVRHLTGTLGLGPALDSGITAGWRHDPAEPVPSRAHPYYPLIEPADEGDLLTRADTLTFTEPPAAHPTVLLGPASVSLDVSVSTRTGMVVATLYDVAPTGSTRRIADGAAQFPADRADLRIDLGHLGYQLEAGHHLALRLSSSSFPRYVLHPGNDTDPWSTTTFTVADYTVERGVLTYSTYEETAP